MGRETQSKRVNQDISINLTRNDLAMNGSGEYE